MPPFRGRQGHLFGMLKRSTRTLLFIGTLGVAFLWVTYSSLNVLPRGYAISAYIKNPWIPQPDQGYHHIGFSFYNSSKNPDSLYQLRWMSRSLLKRSSVKLHFHIVATSLEEYFEATDVIKKVADELGIETPMVSVENATTLIQTFGEEIRHMMSLLTPPGHKFHTEHNALYPYMSHLFDGVSEIILLDLDFRFLDDIKLLFREYENFPSSAVIGCSPDLNPSYHLSLNYYREKAPGTRFGTNHPKHMQGVNSGLLMLKLDALRENPTYNYRINKTGLSELFHEFSFDRTRNWHAGHQDFFTLMSFQHPELFHILSCGWNRNLCPPQHFLHHLQYVPNATDFFLCTDVTKALHGNCGVFLPEEF